MVVFALSDIILLNHQYHIVLTLFVGVDDVHDNCPFDENKSQANNDGDALGDECDSDDDADGA